MDVAHTLLHNTQVKTTADAVLALKIGNERAHFERTYSQLDALWLATSTGSDDVRLLDHRAIESFAGS